MTTRAHVLVAIVGLLLVLFILRLVARRQLRSKYALLWLAVALVVLPLALFPSAIDTLADWVGVEYGPTMLLLLGVGFLLVVVIHLSRELSLVEAHLRAVAEDLALMRAERDGEPEPTP